MELAAVFLTSFLVGFSGAMMPGPMLTVTIAETPRRGLRTGPLLVLGHGVIELVVVVGLVFGLSQVISHTAVKGTIALVGGAVLVWMGVGMARSAWAGQLSLSASADSVPSGPGPVATGALVSASNPYWLLWWATIGATYVAAALQMGTLGLASFFSGHILSDFAWFTFVGALVATGRRLLTDRAYRGLVLACGIALVVLGSTFVFGGITYLSA
ncbi:MAG: LysE family transporter [Chloroflexota bacterium]